MKEVFNGNNPRIEETIKLSNRSGKSKVERTREQAYDDLRRQVHFIRKSCMEFDRGDVQEATRLVSPIINIVFDKGRHTSLLTQLKKKDIQFVDSTSPDTPGNLASYSGLYAVFLGIGQIDLRPHLDRGPASPRLVDFDDWWTTPIFNNRQGTIFSRGSLLRLVRDTDGGAHIDPELDSEYAKFSKDKSDGWIMTVNGEDVKPKTGPDQACLRQIAHEVLATLKQAFPSL